MKKKAVLTVVGLLLLALLLTDNVIALVPPPPVNQFIGAYDTSVNQLNEQICRNCHNAGVPDRHHKLVQAGEYVCNDCHPIRQGINGQFVLLDRNCIDCHSGAAFWANPNLNIGKPHHKTEWALKRDCKFCHGGFIDNFDDGHIIPDFPISEVTPYTDYKAINLITGKKWGGCEACHEPDFLNQRPDIFSNPDTHHIAMDANPLDIGAQKCTWCHDNFQSTEIRKCEACHSTSTLHNIEFNFGQNNGQKGWGHIGDNWDCNGCHAWFVAEEIGFESAIIPNIVSIIIPNIASINPAKLATNTSTSVTIDGSDFLSGTGNYTSVVVVDNTTTLAPTSVTDSKIVVNIPGMSEGIYTIKVVKNGDSQPRPSQLRSLTVVDPVDAVTAKITQRSVKSTEITIIGTGFGSKPESSTDPLFNEHGVWIVNSGKSIQTTLKNWTNTKIVVTTAKANIGNPVTIKAISGDDTLNIAN